MLWPYHSQTNQRQLVVMVTSEVDRHLAVSLSVTVGSIPLLNPDPLIGREVTQVVDLRIIGVFPSHWIYVMVSLALTTPSEKEC
jgi:hypothetical protein